jgi:hypothetical protein
MSAEVFRPVDPEEIHFKLPILGDISFGKRVLQMSEISSDHETISGVLAMKAALEKGPGIILDSHRLKSALDIISTAAQIIRALEPDEIVVPTAASFYNAQRGIYPYVVKAIRETRGMKVMIVYREEDRKSAARKDKTQGDISRLGMVQKNKEYMSQMTDNLVSPHNLGFIAPYGSRRTFGEEEKIRSGVTRLLKGGVPILCTFSRFKPSTMRFRMYASGKLLQFSRESSNEEIKTKVHHEFQELQHRGK